MVIELLDILLILAICSPLIPLTSILLRKNRVSKFLFRTLFTICLLGLLSDVLSYFLAINGAGVEIIFHIYTILVSIFIFRLFKHEINLPFIEKVISIISVSFVFLSLYFLFFENGFNEYNPEPYIVLSILIIMLTGYYFYYVFINLEIPKITEYYFFWINAAFVIYFSSTFFITVFEELLISAETQIILWPIQHAFAIMFNVIIAKGIWTIKD